MKTHTNQSSIVLGIQVSLVTHPWPWFINENENEFIIYNNIIKVGIYTITLYFPFDSSPHWRKLKDYGDFHIRIHDTIDQKSDIDIKIDSRFKSQYWVSKNFFGQLRIKHLIEIIAYCSRLNNLKAFY